MASVGRRVARAALPLLLCACAAGEAAERRELLARRDAGQLVGIWDVSFAADTAATVFRLRHMDTLAAGTLAFTLNRGGPWSRSSLGAITHEGVYDVDFEPMGFTTRPSDGTALAMAHLGHAAGGRGSQRGDSLVIVLSPGSDQFPVRMTGLFTGDAARGTWTTEARRAGGGQGHFTMRRH